MFLKAGITFGSESFPNVLRIGSTLLLSFCAVRYVRRLTLAVLKLDFETVRNASSTCPFFKEENLSVVVSEMLVAGAVVVEKALDEVLLVTPRASQFADESSWSRISKFS